MNRVAVVTGGGSGIGQSICNRLASDGHQVAVLDLNAENAEATASALRDRGHQALGLVVDVADRSSVDQAYATIRSELGPIAILVTSAAISGFTPVEDIGVDLWDRMIAVNLSGTFHCIQAAVDEMVTAGWGRIVTISSVAGQTASARQVHYSASKAGVIGMTKSLALELAPKGVTANTIPPFMVDTPLLRSQQAAGALPPIEMLSRAVPAGRLTTGDDIAAACAFLCSDEASHITGQVIAVNGGGYI
jgi:2-hydroxycyclohexanecarboxyl-CoA dehydrogenase